MNENTTTTDVPVSAKTGVQKPVEIIDDNGHVNPKHDPVHVGKSAGDAVVWVAKNGKNSTIIFNSPAGSPFNAQTFNVPADDNASSGPVRKDAPLGGYKYTVTGEKGKNDPVVIVRD